MDRNTQSPSRILHQQPRIGWLADLEQLAGNPNRMAEVQDRLGVNTIWLESGRYHTAGYRLSDETWESSPFKDWRSRPGLVRHRQARRLPEETFPVLPGILSGADDSDLMTVIEYASRLGIDVWGHLGLWSYGGMIYPELAVHTLAGKPIPAEEDRWGACFCTNKPALNNWLSACLEDSIKKYPLQGMEVDHARYIPPQSLPNLLACGCPDCVRRAAEFGTDLPALAETILGGLERLKRAPAELIRNTLGESRTFLEAFDNLIKDQAASRWMTLRAQFLSSAIQDLTAAVRQTGDETFKFGIDVLPPSVALLAGHQYADLTCLDYFTGGFGTIGWEWAGLNTCQEWSSFLLRLWPELEQKFVLTQLLRLLGFSENTLAVRNMNFERPEKNVLSTFECQEIRRIAQLRPAEMPVYPPASLPALGASGLEMVCQAIRENGLDGVIIAGLEKLSKEEEQQVAGALKALG